MMDAKELLTTVIRECKKHGYCNQCPFYKNFCCQRIYFDLFDEEKTNKIIAIAEKLAHVKTYADDFFEKNPEASKEEDGTPRVCRENVYRAKNPACGGDGECYRCWNEPMPEEEIEQ